MFLANGFFGFMLPTYFHNIGVQKRLERNSPPPVKYFNVFSDGLHRLSTNYKLAVVHLLIFEQSPETLHRGIIVTISPPRHGGDHAELVEQFPVFMCAILAAAIRVMNQLSGRF